MKSITCLVTEAWCFIRARHHLRVCPLALGSRRGVIVLVTEGERTRLRRRSVERIFLLLSARCCSTILIIKYEFRFRIAMTRYLSSTGKVAGGSKALC